MGRSLIFSLTKHHTLTCENPQRVHPYTVHGTTSVCTPDGDPRGLCGGIIGRGGVEEMEAMAGTSYYCWVCWLLASARHLRRLSPSPLPRSLLQKREMDYQRIHLLFFFAT